MPFPAPLLKQLEIKEYTGTPLALTTIKKQAQANESGSGFPVVDLELPAALPAGNYFGAGKAVALSTPDRQVYSAAAPPFETTRRAFVAMLHHSLPKNVRLLLARDTAVTTLAAASAVDAFDTVGLTYAAATPEAYVNAARVNIKEPFFMFEDSATELVGGLHMQLHRSATSVAYDPAKDQGNAGRAVLAFFVPLAEGLISGRASEFASETAGDGPAWVLFRPVYDNSLAPDVPYLDDAPSTYPDGVDDTVTPPWRQLGCLQSLKEFNRLIEYAETMKNYNNDVIDRSISQHRAEFNCVMSGKNVYGMAAMYGGTVTDENVAFKKIKPSSQLDYYEVLCISTNSKGYVRAIYAPNVNVTPNGAEQMGARGESVIPFKIMVNTAPDDILSNSLYQMSQLIINCKLT